jgi:Xaa-Pro aminopeptidase
MMNLIKVNLLIIFLIFFIADAFSQKDTPKDQLNKEFHQQRREALRKSMPSNSVAVFFANPVRNRANDVDFHYHQNPDFFYLTGYKEPNSVLLIFSEDQKDAKNQSYNEVFFVQRRDAKLEQWNGRRLGAEGVKEQLGFRHAFEGKDLKNYNIAFNSFDKILFFDFKDDVLNDKKDQADLYDLISQFKEKIAYPTGADGGKKIIYELIQNNNTSDNQDVMQIIQKHIRSYPELKNDPVIAAYTTAKTPEDRITIKGQIPTPQLNHDIKQLDILMTRLREIKTTEEIKLLRKAVDISAIGQVEVMKAMHPNMSETEIQGIHEFVYKKYGADYEGYPSIVGAGENACILHYVENNKPKVGNELVLMDLGAEYRGYTADVTRTIPANGKFSPEQKAIYELVLEAQEASFTNCKPGNSFSQNTELAREIVNKGLVKLGIIRNEKQEHNYFPHGVSHHIGLDVHDRGFYDKMEENMVITVEPGIYIPEGSPCDKKWWGIGVRIEDDILITKNGFELLSDKAPRTVEEIEKMMAQKSVLDQFVLPELK